LRNRPPALIEQTLADSSDDQGHLEDRLQFTLRELIICGAI